MNRFHPLSREGNPHGNLTAFPGALRWTFHMLGEHLAAAAMGSGTGEGSAAARLLWISLGLPSLGNVCALNFCSPENPAQSLAQCFRTYFAFEKHHFKSVSARSFWLFPGQQKYQNSTLAPFVTR